MFLSSLIEEFCTKKENNKAGCTLTFGGQCIKNIQKEIGIFSKYSFNCACINDSKKNCLCIS